ncbi:MAG: DUF3276 family protein [Ferruginibacter sp.]
MAYDNNDKKMESVYSKRIRAGKRRTYFFDVRETRGNDYYLTITESRKRFDSDGYDRHKIFLYKEDFNKFIKGLGEAIDHVKTELMPDFDFDAFNHDTPYESEEGQQQGPAVENTTEEKPVAIVQEVVPAAAEEPAAPQDNGSTEEVDKW